MYDTELHYSQALIDRAERRIAHQHAAIVDLTDPAMYDFGHMILDAMQKKLDALHAHHRRLVRDATASRAEDIRSRVDAQQNGSLYVLRSAPSE